RNNATIEATVTKCATSANPCTVIQGPEKIEKIESKTSVTYTFSGDATGCTWHVPAGWVIESGQGTNSITVAVGDTNGDVIVEQYGTQLMRKQVAVFTPSPLPVT